MNAEFTEKKIVLTSETVEGETVITVTPAKVRKGLDPKAFVGAMVCGPASSYLVIGALVTGTVITLDIGSATAHITYDPATGDLTYVMPDEEPEQTPEPGTT